ncbi:hypothetical protein SLE2022_343510 [Rubroshorea leprosula]
MPAAMLFRRLLLASFITFFLANFAFTATLPDTELKALRDIAKTLGKTDWNFSVDPCSGESGWVLPENEIIKFKMNVTCSNDTILPHVVGIELEGQNLDGTLPPELGRFPFLRNIDLTRNYLSGPIPPEWGSMEKIEHISLLGNRLTGSIPKQIGNLRTLKTFTVEFNKLSGTLPPELGNLASIQSLIISYQSLIRFFLSSNNFTGELSARISDNRFTGGIPDFIQNWTNLEKLVIQASGLMGPIPSNISALAKLKDLRISDLNGTDQGKFPPLIGIELNTLTLRSCNILDELPKYLGEMKSLTALDLSFNKLSGAIPKSFSNLVAVDYIYLTRNLLIGIIPDWILQNGNNIDLSYNNFTPRTSTKLSANGSLSIVKQVIFMLDDLFHLVLFSHRNLFASYPRSNELGIVSCLRSSKCEKKRYYLHINCGGEKVIVNKTGYEDDSDQHVPSRLIVHSEIMFTDDKTYKSLGRHIFDIYIQGKLVQKDFNIVDEAGGVGRAIIRNFSAAVTKAISVNPNFTPPFKNWGMVVGILVGASFVILLISGIRWWKCCLRQKNILEQDLKGLGLQTGSFSLRQIKAATNNFDPANKIGEGGFGPVYKGHLTDGKAIAVKQLLAKSKQGNHEFVNEIGMISALQHPHLVKLYGCCIEGNQLLLIYEYMENNNLARALFGPKECQLKLDWPTRQKICIGIARCLAYLHEESRLKIVHRDIKATNVLLDKDLNPKISNFGLAKLNEEDNTHISTRIAGTMGYMAPKYAMRGYLIDKAHVYSFGIVALEIVNGRSNTISKTKENSFYLLDWALLLEEKGNLLEFVDPRLGSNYNKNEAIKMINVALLCTNPAPAARPIMSSIVSMLEGKTNVDELSLDPGASIELLRKFYQTLEEEGTQENQTKSTYLQNRD